ncbi:MAG: hypothetical protein AAFP78_06410, partial [Pseudomonadota bacterium]
LCLRFGMQPGASQGFAEIVTFKTAVAREKVRTAEAISPDLKRRLIREICDMEAAFAAAGGLSAAPRRIDRAEARFEELSGILSRLERLAQADVEITEEARREERGLAPVSGEAPKLVRMAGAGA